ncbi:hypothetical protein AGMMS50296_8730 [Alphaproteobacteria bacterium]|nr:hypothetical protein AGMMS50296_8730 [Alphaproteobacteria bacterium]
MDVDLLEELGEWIEIPEEFDTDKWWINRQYFDLTLGYGSQRCVPISKTHDHGFCCDTMYELLDEEGHGSFRLYVKYIPNIKAYVILNKKKKYGGFESMDYCPFCGAKFPNRLDKELTKILREEYGLNSWQDYKKAPKEFHTDAWWKNRNLEERCFEYSLVS